MRDAQYSNVNGVRSSKVFMEHVQVVGCSRVLLRKPSKARTKGLSAVYHMLLDFLHLPGLCSQKV